MWVTECRASLVVESRFERCGAVRVRMVVSLLSAVIGKGVRRCKVESGCDSLVNVA